MAQIPTKERLGPLAQLASRPGFRPAEDNTGAALAGFGNTLQRVGSNAMAYATEEAQRRATELERAQAFNTEQGLQRLSIDAAAEVPNIQQRVPASGFGLRDEAIKDFDKRADEFYKNTPPALQERVGQLLETERATFMAKVGDDETKQRHGWYRTTINDRFSRAQGAVFNDPASLERERAETLSAIDTSDLLTAEKEELKTQVKAGIASSLAARLMTDDPAYLQSNVGIASAPAGGSLVDAVIKVESQGQAGAISPKGAAGLMQVMPATGAEIAQELGDANFPAGGTVAQQQAYLRQPEVSKRYGTHYLGKMLERYNGDQAAALIAYNGGTKRADAWLASGRDDSAIPSESAGYYKKVLGAVGGMIGAASPVVRSHIDLAKAFLGASEANDSGTIAAFIKKATGTTVDPTKTAWCAYWLNAVFQSQGVQGTGSGMARSFLNFGTETDQPQPGDVVVLQRGGANAPTGHVGILAGFDEKGNPKILGGNQGNAVSVRTFDKAQVLGYRRPPDVGTAEKARADLDTLPGGGPSNGLVVTQLDPRLADLPFSERLKLFSDAQKASAQRQTKLEAEAKANYASYNDNVELRILTGKVTSEDEILNDGTLTDGDKASRLRSFRTQQGENGKVDAAVQSYLGGGLTNLNPLNTDQAQLANKVYDKLAPSLQGQPEDVQQAAVGQFIQRTQIIPQPVQAQLRLGAMSNDPAMLADSLTRATRVASLAPNAFRSMAGGGDMQNDVTSFNSLVNERGFSAEQAAQRIIERRSPEWAKNASVRSQDAEKKAKDLSASQITSAFDEGLMSSSPGAGADPGTQASLTVQYKDAFREAFIRTGDETEAKAQAISELKRTWGISNVSGAKQLMQYPPELFFKPIDGSQDYIRTDAMATAKDAADAEVSNVFLKPWVDAQTGRNLTAEDVRAGRPPRYRVAYVREVDGQKIIDTVPGTWSITPAAAEAARARKLQEAQQKREAVDASQDRRRTVLGVELSSPREQRAVIRERFGLDNAPDAVPASDLASALQRQRNDLIEPSANEIMRSERDASR